MISKMPGENRAFFLGLYSFLPKKNVHHRRTFFNIGVTNYATDRRMMFSAAPALNHSICC
jgi:hypothetical protein